MKIVLKQKTYKCETDLGSLLLKQKGDTEFMFLQIDDLKMEFDIFNIPYPIELSTDCKLFEKQAVDNVRKVEEAINKGLKALFKAENIVKATMYKTETIFTGNEPDYEYTLIDVTDDVINRFKEKNE